MTAEIIYRNTDELNLLDRNPRTITKQEFDRLKQSVERNPDYFEARPLILSNRTGKLVVIAGNQRLRAAQALGLTEVPTVLLEGLSKEREDEIILRDNISNGAFDMDILANDFEIELLQDIGINVPDWSEDNEVHDKASDGSVADYDDDLDYDLTKLYKNRVASDIVDMFNKAVEAGEVRDEIADILRTRMAQCAIFDFGQITRFYRSDDASEAERELLRRLYLVFITPREAFEAGLLKIDAVAGNIFANNLMEAEDGDSDDED